MYATETVDACSRVHLSGTCHRVELSANTCVARALPDTKPNTLCPLALRPANSRPKYAPWSAVSALKNGNQEPAANNTSMWLTGA